MSNLSQPPMHAKRGSVGWMRQFRYFSELYRQLKGIKGDIVECGVGQGTTFSMLCYLAGSEDAGRTVRGFDSFAGFPQPTEADASWRNPQKGEWAFGQDVTEGLLTELDLLTAYPGLQFRLTKGFFVDTLPLEPTYPVAFLHVDADLYESCRDVMQFMMPRVVSGGIVAFDDYRDIGRGAEKGEKWPGATRAIDEALVEYDLSPVAYHESAADYEFTKYYVVRP